MGTKEVALGWNDTSRPAARAALALGAPRPDLERSLRLSASPAMAHVIELVDGVARSPDTTVLVLGESGTGKELIARLLHAKTPRRRDGPLVQVDCGGLPEKPLDRELFGAERRHGTKPRPGLLEQARGGTLFLDEVGDLPFPLQAKLVRVLETSHFRRAGAAGEIAVDFRLVSGTRRDLAMAVRSGTLRADLFHRLDVFPIRVPPLRERKEDILPLARLFLAELSARAGKEIAELAPQTERRLLAYPFPGNVRELHNVIERAVILERGPVLSPSSLVLREEGPDLEPAPAPGAGAFVPKAHSPGVRPPTLEEVEKAYVVRLLERAHGNRSQVARWMGVSYPTVMKKIIDYGIDVSRFGG